MRMTRLGSSLPWKRADGNVKTSTVVCALTLLALPIRAGAQERLPIIDMHLHAMTADDNGPPPIALCVPFISHLPSLDSRRP